MRNGQTPMVCARIWIIGKENGAIIIDPQAGISPTALFGDPKGIVGSDLKIFQFDVLLPSLWF